MVGQPHSLPLLKNKIIIVRVICNRGGEPNKGTAAFPTVTREWRAAKGELRKYLALVLVA
jgi:hypothetical protein